MSTTKAAVAIARLRSLSDDRARKVYSLIEDLKDAREALSEMRALAASPSAPAQFFLDCAKLKNSSKGAFTAGRGRSKRDLDETKGFITGGEPFG